VADWIFQANPKRYDVHAAVTRSPQDWWNTPRYRDRIALNDRVWLQIVGPDRPGIYYLATIVSLPYESPENEFGPWHTDIRWDYRIDPPLDRPELVGDPALQSFLGIPRLPGVERARPCGDCIEADGACAAAARGAGQ
jgi:hypothetical protein